ncbi:MAG: serine/threonine protein kinase [Glaciecola sp.]|jgi:serine/threonine protein kinase
MAHFSIQILKEDSLGRVEWVEQEGVGAAWIRRVACGGRWPFSGWLARRLMARERSALARLDTVPGMPRLLDSQSVEFDRIAKLSSPDRGTPQSQDLLIREATQGSALHQAKRLPMNFFDRLEELVAAVHAQGICHNDLHKEQNIMVDALGFPGLIDFQLASVHARATRAFRIRCHEDLRHIQKHRRRYLRDGRGPDGAPFEASIQAGAGAGLRRRPLSLVWRRTGKPLYHFITRRILRRWDGEERRESSGPWPEWTGPLGPWSERNF